MKNLPKRIAQAASARFSNYVPGQTSAEEFPVSPPRRTTELGRKLGVHAMW